MKFLEKGYKEEHVEQAFMKYLMRYDESHPQDTQENSSKPQNNRQIYNKQNNTKSIRFGIRYSTKAFDIQ